MGWQKGTSYGRRSLAETAMGRYKAIVGPRLHARSLDGQRMEADIGVSALNRMLAVGLPEIRSQSGKKLIELGWKENVGLHLSMHQRHIWTSDPALSDPGNRFYSRISAS